MTASQGGTMNEKEKDRPKRAFSTHKPKWQKFQPTLLVPSEKTGNQMSNEAKEVYAYQRQYSHVYSHRLVALKPRCLEVMSDDKSKHSSGAPYNRINRILELREKRPSRIVGTIVKEPNDRDEDPIVEGTECRPSDQLFLEDESGRVALNLENSHRFPTGVVIGVQGVVDNMGTFHVDKLFLPAPAPHDDVSEEKQSSESSERTPHLLLVSSLLCGDPNVSSLPREMLLSYLQGQYTDDAAKVSRVLLVGGGASAKEQLQGIKELDGFGLQLTKSGIPIDIMPSREDPTTANWPQRPLHSSLLPHAAKGMVYRATNPYCARHNSKLVAATDGLNIHDLQTHMLSEDKESKISELEALRHTLEWGHMCPTGPSSVPTVPHVEEDPMVLDQTPDVYVCGNCEKFDSVTMDIRSNKTTLICVPKFSETGEAVLVNLESGSVELLRFDDSEM